MVAGMKRRSLVAWVVIVAVLAAGCSTRGGVTFRPVPSIASPYASQRAGGRLDSPTPTEASAANSLFGRWRRLGSCVQFFEAVRKAGVIDQIPKWVAGGVYLASPANAATAADPCDGATSVYHTHSFSPDLQFASYDENGEQADDGTYTLLGDDTIVFGVVRVRYRIDASDHLSFTDVWFPPCPSPAPQRSPGASPSLPAADEWTCRDNAGWAISAFYPGSYERLAP
jgi:hypothetical protein